MTPARMAPPLAPDPTIILTPDIHEEPDMKAAILALVAVGSVMTSNAALAQLNADDVKWINQCIADNKGGAKEEVVRKYCMCINEKMDNSETKSITQWEKTHPKEREACDKESGWK
jgi:hypothetical protein